MTGFVPFSAAGYGQIGCSKSSVGRVFRSLAATVEIPRRFWYHVPSNDRRNGHVATDSIRFNVLCAIDRGRWSESMKSFSANGLSSAATIVSVNFRSERPVLRSSSMPYRNVPPRYTSSRKAATETPKCPATRLSPGEEDLHAPPPLSSPAQVWLQSITTSGPCSSRSRAAIASAMFRARLRSSLSECLKRATVGCGVRHRCGHVTKGIETEGARAERYQIGCTSGARRRASGRYRRPAYSACVGSLRRAIARLTGQPGRNH